VHNAFKKWASLFGAAAAALGLLGLSAWVLGMPLLASIRSSYIPMAPVTSVAFLCLGGVLLVHALTPRQGVAGMVVTALSVLISAYGLIELVEETGIRVLSLEEWLFPNPPMMGSIPTGRISPTTAAILLLSGGVVPMLVLGARTGQLLRLLGDLAGWLGMIVAATGAVFVLGYMHGTPLLYGTATIPMAATTSLAVLLLGIGQVLAAGPDHFPLRFFAGPSARARLLRAFVTTTVGAVLAIDLLHVYVRWIFFEDDPFMSGVSIAAFALITGALIARVALKVGDDMDRSEEVRRQAEDKLRESEDRYRDLVEHSQELICTHDLEGRILSVNPWAAKVLGYTPDELMRMDFREILAPKVHHLFGKYLDEIRTHGAARGILLVQTRKGEQLIWEFKNTLRTDGVAEPVVRGMAQDITERKRAEERLRETTQRLQLATTAGGIGIWDLDIHSDMLIWDDRMFELYGVSKDAFSPGLDAWEKCLHPDDRAEAAEAVRAAIRGDKEFDTEFRVVHPGGKVKFLQANGIVIRNAVGKATRMIGMNRDITERRNLEQRLRQSQKIEAVGRLAGGIAHDFNNLLTVINGYSEILLNRLAEGSPLRKEVEEIKRAGDSAATLTRQLLAFSRRQVLQPEVIDLNEVIPQMDMMLRRLIGEDVEFRTVLGTELWSVKADPGQIEQVLMNLVVNARDAMPGGGKLTIETSNVVLSEEYSKGHNPVTPGPYVMLAISDTGAGMDEKTAAKIFEPFFTTKERGKGTGLGLSTVYGIVKQSAGFIWVYSEPGKGSTFKIYLPRTEDRREFPDKEAPPVEDLRGEKTVLVVEDEESIRKLATEILGQYGYAVISAGDGEEALTTAGEHKGEIGLLLTDVVMPRMGGRELYERLRQLRPGIKVLYMSGYTDNAIVHQGVLDPGIAFLQKPYSPISLLRKVKEVLEEN
jgi:PAS domain S-box-containing protein